MMVDAMIGNKSNNVGSDRRDTYLSGWTNTICRGCSSKMMMMHLSLMCTVHGQTEAVMRVWMLRLIVSMDFSVSLRGGGDWAVFFNPKRRGVSLCRSIDPGSQPWLP
jgi:hypothetical protein